MRQAIVVNTKPIKNTKLLKLHVLLPFFLILCALTLPGHEMFLNEMQALRKS